MPRPDSGKAAGAFSGAPLCPHSPFTPRHGLDGFLGKPALGLSIASNDPSNMVPHAKCWGVNEKIISRAVLELDDELAVSVCCHGTFLKSQPPTSGQTGERYGIKIEPMSPLCVRCVPPNPQDPVR